jgi:hypothetical protein
MEDMMKGFYSGFYRLILLTLLMMGVRAQDLSFPEKDFATPQAALEHVTQSLAANDVAAALQAFAINAQAEKRDFTAMSERLGVIQMFQSPSPSEYPMYVELNRLTFVSRYASQIKLFTYSLLLQTTETFEDFDPYLTLPIQSEPDLVREFVRVSDPEKLRGLSIDKLFRITATSEKMLENWQAQARPVGANEITEFVVLYRLGNNVYFGGARMLRYGESWKLDGLNSVVAGTEAGGNAVLTTQEDFEVLVAELKDSENWRLEELPLD